MASFKVLIIEDDTILSESISRMLVGMGIDASVADSGKEARKMMLEGKYNFVLVDCLLPDEQGVDLVKEFSSKDKVNFTVFALMSGVFTDPSSISESKQESGAEHFFIKPFDLGDIKAVVQPLVGSFHQEHASENPLSVLFDVSASHRKKKRIIEKLEVVDGFDLPMIYSILVETKSSGHLVLLYNRSEVAGVSFCEGNIVKVDLYDKTSYLGQMLVEYGYLSQYELEEQLKVKDNLKLGERLIQKCYISPHAFDELLRLQMNIRLSKTIDFSSIKMNFVPAEVELEEPYIEAEIYISFLHDWIVSKISSSWIEARLRPYYSSNITQGPLYTEENSVFSSKLLSSLPNLWEEMMHSANVGALIESNKFKKEMLLKAIHYLLIKRVILFDETSITSFSHFEKQVTSLLTNARGKNHLKVFELVSGRPLGENDDFNGIYDEFLSFVNRKGVDSMSQEFAGKMEELTLIVKKAFDVLGKSSSRKEYLKNLQQNEFNLKLENQNLYQDSIRHLKDGECEKALVQLELLSERGLKAENFNLHLAWAKILCLEKGTRQNLKLSDVEYELMQIPPEEKHGPLYAFVLGKEKALQGHLAEAKKYFEKAISLDPRQIEARRELNRILYKSKNSNKNKDFLQRDLKDMVTSLFRKKGS